MANGIACCGSNGRYAGNVRGDFLCFKPCRQPGCHICSVKMVPVEIARNGYSVEFLRKDGLYALFFHVGDH